VDGKRAFEPFRPKDTWVARATARALTAAFRGDTLRTGETCHRDPELEAITPAGWPVVQGETVAQQPRAQLDRPHRSDQADVEALFREHHARIVALISERFPHAIAEDVASKVFVKLLTGSRPDPDRPAWPWLRKVAINAAIDHLRVNRRHEPLEVALDRTDGRDESEDAVQRLLVDDALNHLSDAERIAVTGTVIGVPAAEIARRVGRSTQAVHSIAARARKRLRLLLEPVVIPVYGLLAWLRRVLSQPQAAGTQLALEAVVLAALAFGLPGSFAPSPSRVADALVRPVAAAIEPTTIERDAPRSAGSGTAFAGANPGPVDPDPTNRGVEPEVTIDHQDGATVPHEIVVYWPTVDTPFGPAGGETRFGCLSHGFEALPRQDNLYRLC
jgi:RNA polymerase sigma factor (sigma-70 family)